MRRSRCLGIFIVCCVPYVDSAKGATESSRAAPDSGQRHGVSAAPRAGAHTVRHGAGAAPPQVPEQLRVMSTARTQSHGTSEVVSRAMMDKFVPGTSAVKMLAQLPGVQFTSSDALGVDTWSSTLYARGFVQDQMGFTLDGVPLGDQGYFTYNGLKSQAAIAPENIASMDISQGAGAVDAPGTTNLGGQISMVSSNPLQKAGARVSQSFGSWNAYHTFVRVDSGNLNRTGTRFYVSYVRNDTDKWKGAGYQFEQNVNAKLVQPLKNNSELSFFFDWNNLVQPVDYQDLSFNFLKVYGTRLDNYYPNYTNAYNAAAGKYTLGQDKTNDPKDVAYYDVGRVWNDYLAYTKLKLNMTNHLSWDTTLYGHGQKAMGVFTNPFHASPNGAPLSEQIKRPWLMRYGFTSGMNWHMGHNVLKAGIWYEYYRNAISQTLYEAPLLGQGVPDPNHLGAAFDRMWAFDFNTNTFMGYVEDQYYIKPNLVASVGFKAMTSTTRGSQVANNTGEAALAQGSLNASDGFLPHFNVDYHLDRHSELYFDIAKNLRTYADGGYGLGSVWGVTNLQTFNEMKKVIKPETDWTYMVGYRYQAKKLSASVSFYHTDFFNRLQTIASGNIVNPTDSVANVGSVHMNGVDVGATLRPVKGLSFYNSFSYNHGWYGSDVSDGGTTYHTRGKKIVNYPSFMYKTQLAYAYRGAEVHFDASYMSSRPFDYMNTLHVPSYWLASMGARYNFDRVGPLSTLSVGFNVYNLFNSTYIGTMGDNGNPMQGDYQSFSIGAPRSFFGTISASY